MKRAVFLIPFFVYAGILSDLKEKEFGYDIQKSIKDSLETKRSWINPIILNVSTSKSSGGVNTTTFSATLNQPIFKSGAIYYSIKYAALAKKYNLNNIELTKKALIKSAYDLAFDYQINRVNKKILLLQIENAKIDVLRKREAFLSGALDSSFLDNAILNLNNLKLSLEDIKLTLLKLKHSFNNLSDLKIDEVKLPSFRLLSEVEYLKNNIELNSQKDYSKVKEYLYKMQRGNQLLTVSINANYNYQIVKDRFSDKQNYYSFGISASLPLDINAKTRIEKTKLDYLKSKVLLEDKKRELINTYKMVLKVVQNLENKEKIYNENIKIYDNLINSTIEGIRGGDKTALDLKVLKNSKEIMKLNIMKLKLMYQKELLGLYYKLVTFKD